MTITRRAALKLIGCGLVSSAAPAHLAWGELEEEPPEWLSVIEASSPKWICGESDKAIRQRLMLALLKQKGRIQFNSQSIGWEVRT